MPPVYFELSFFTGCNRCLSSAARSRANSGILIIALATGMGLVTAESELISYWLAKTTVQSTEFHLMKGSVQQAAARGCSLRVDDPAACHFSLSINVGASLPVWNAKICIITQISSTLGVKIQPTCEFKSPRDADSLSIVYHDMQDFISLCCSAPPGAIIKSVVFWSDILWSMP